MKGYFSFPWEFTDSARHRRSCHFAFKAPGRASDLDLADVLEQQLQTTLCPDVVCIVTIPTEHRETVNTLKNSLIVRQARKRAMHRCSIVCGTFDKHGRIGNLEVLDNPASWFGVAIRRSAFQILECGLSALFDSSRVLVQAPPGFVFVKPSGRRATVFLRTEEALYESERASYLAYALLPRVAKRTRDTRSSIQVIYIDSMAIASVAFCLRDLYRDLYSEPIPRVVSFHSYDGLDSLDAPLPGTALCLISASTTMSLEAEWLQKTRCRPSEVVTLLTLSTASDCMRALHALDAPEAPPAGHIANVAELHDLPIAGERFSPQEIRPKQVLLRRPSHGIEHLSKLGERFAPHKIFRIHAQRDGSKVRTLFVDGDNLRKHPEFKAFLAATIDQRTPASIQAIVYQDDASSLALAQQCLAYARGRLPGSTIALHSSTEVANGDAVLDKRRAILVIAAVIGKGTRLLSISRDLRDLHLGARTYLVGALVSETAQQATLLEKNLRFSASGATVVVDVFLRLSIGRAIRQSYEVERALLPRLLPSSLLSKSKLEQRLAQLASNTGFADNAFLPAGSLLDEKLRLRSDFAFWTAGYKPVPELTPCVIATVASILQRAREERFVDPDDRLSSDVFQQVVLNPENFVRFNDGVVQAALLRATYPSELDYSCDSSYSDSMLSVIVKVFQNCEKVHGEAALEFALALASFKLRLHPKSTDALRHLLRDLPKTRLMPKVLRLILSLDVTRRPATPQQF